MQTDEQGFEAILDARVMRRLATDRRYRNAESSEEQAAAERRIELEEELGLLEQRQRARMSRGDLPRLGDAARIGDIRQELADLAELEQHPDPFAGRASVKA